MTNFDKTHLHVGQVAAFGLHDGSCRAGMVSEIAEDHFKVDLLSWDGGLRSPDATRAVREVSYGEVVEVCRAFWEYDAERDEKVWITTPLSNFERQWQETHA